MDFLGRQKELKKLHEMWKPDQASLVVCQGRRRIGKSTLIKKFAQEAPHFFEFQGLAPRANLTEIDQLKNFSEQLAKQTKLPALPLQNWTQAFTLLASQLGTKKTVLFFDEISWMASSDPDFVGKLKIAWDTQFKTKRQLIVVLCGSVSSWIDANILNETDFMGRISLTLTVDELPLQDCMTFFKKSKGHIACFEKLKILAITGGVPRYLEEIHPKWEAEKNIQELCFKKGAVLLEEFDRIFNDIFDKRAKIYAELVQAIASGHKNFSQICKAMGREKNGVITQYLKDLERSGFIAHDQSFYPGGKSSKLSRYRIKDNYLRFYLKYILPNKSKIEKGLFKYPGTDRLGNFEAILGLQFENLLLNNLPWLLGCLDLPLESIVNAAPYLQNKTSKNKGGCQIDLLIESNSKCLYVCEFKLRHKITETVISEVQNKIDVLVRPKTYSIRPVLIYEGQISPSIKKSDFFAKILKISDLP